MKKNTKLTKFQLLSSRSVLDLQIIGPWMGGDGCLVNVLWRKGTKGRKHDTITEEVGWMSETREGKSRRTGLLK